MSYGDDLYRELTGAGISGRLRARIVDEFRDHLECDPQADLGPPRELAHQFADEIGTSRARTAGLRAFAALVVAGVAFALAFALDPGRFFGGHTHLSRFVWLVLVVVAVATQVALATGLLAAARVFRCRRERVVSAAEARIILRRVTVSLFSGLVSMVALGILAAERSTTAPGWWVTLAEVLAGVGTAGILLVTPAALAAARVRPTAAGPGGDLSDDLGPLLPPPLRNQPWHIALLLAGAIFVFFTATGVLTSDPYDGALRGLMDGLACLLGFATVGRYVGLWHPRAAADARA
jgi:hypothetical protein